MIIDIYNHLISKRVGDILVKGKYYGPGKEFPYPPQNADVDVRLGLMEKYGVDMQILCQTTPVLLGLNAQEAATICKMSNDDNYAMCKAYPKKFANVCIMSLLDVKGAMDAN